MNMEEKNAPAGGGSKGKAGDEISSHLSDSTTNRDASQATFGERAMRAKSFGEVTQFTPLFDEMIEKYGREGAAVYGLFWRRSGKGEGTCYASIENMARDLKMGRKTLVKYRDILIEASELFVKKREGYTDLYSVIPFEEDTMPQNDPASIDATPPTKLTRPPRVKRRDEERIKETSIKKQKNDSESDDHFQNLINEIWQEQNDYDELVVKYTDPWVRTAIRDYLAQRKKRKINSPKNYIEKILENRLIKANKERSAAKTSSRGSNHQGQMETLEDLGGWLEVQAEQGVQPLD